MPPPICCRRQHFSPRYGTPGFLDPDAPRVPLLRSSRRREWDDEVRHPHPLSAKTSPRGSDPQASPIPRTKVRFRAIVSLVKIVGLRWWCSLVVVLVGGGRMRVCMVVVGGGAWDLDGHGSGLLTSQNLDRREANETATQPNRIEVPGSLHAFDAGD